MGRLRALVRALFGRATLDREMTEEVAFHLEARAADLVKAGLPPGEARRRARLEFGAIEAYKDDAREARGWRVLHDLRADAIYAGRMMRRTPGFTLTAIVSLALGVGANTLVFSVVNALVLRPLPVDRPEQIVFLESPGGRVSYSFPDYRDLRDRTRAFAGLIGYRVSPMNLGDDHGASRVWGYLATGNYFDVLGVKPALGRFFHQQDDRAPGASPYAVLSDDCWRARFASDPQIAGRIVRINQRSYTVLGVAPPGFHGTEVFYRPEIWVPMTMQAEIEIGNPWLENRMSGNTWVSGRLLPGVTTSQAESDLNAIAADIARAYPASDQGLRLQLARPGLIGDALGTPVKAFTTGVLALAVLVLLAACLNLAAVLSARGADRRREMAIRLSIGAGRARLVRQLLTEAGVLSVLGGTAGYALAWFASRALSAWRLPVELPVQFDVRPDPRVFLFAFGISMAAGLLFGLAPARQATRTNPNTVLKGTDTASRLVRRWAFREALVVLQVALCFVLVSACLLSLRGLQQALTMPMGLKTQGLSMVGFEVGLGGYDTAQGEAFQRRALDAIARLPGVTSAAYSNSLPLNIDESNTVVYPDDQPNLKPAEALGAVHYKVSPGFFRTLGAELRQGRDIAWSDDSRAPRVAVVNETFARKVLRTASPIGRRFRYGYNATPIEVVGVVEDGKYVALTEAPRPAVFDPILQLTSTETMVLARSALPADEMVAAMRRAIGALDPAMPLYEAESAEEMLGLALFPSRAAAIALGAFGVLAMALAATGLYGVVAYSVARREREFGIRLAVGARPVDVLRLAVTRIAILLAIGAAIGLALALLAGDVFASVVYQASPRDPVVLGAVGLGMTAIGVLSCWAPARRALRVSPVIALRAD